MTTNGIFPSMEQGAAFSSSVLNWLNATMHLNKLENMAWVRFNITNRRDLAEELGNPHRVRKHF